MVHNDVASLLLHLQPHVEVKGFSIYFFPCDANGDIKGNELNGMSNILACFQCLCLRASKAAHKLICIKSD